MDNSLNVENATVKKPGTVRAIFIMNGILPFLAFGFFIAMSNGFLNADEATTTKVLYTAISYIGLFGLTVLGLLKRNAWIVRASLAIVVAASIPTGAVIGIAVAIISTILTFTKSAKAYFAT